MREERIELMGLRFSENRTYGGDGDIKILAEDIKLNGLINPITVKESVDGGNGDPIYAVHEVVAGRRRVRAVTMLGWKDIPCRVLEGDEAERAEEIAGSENINRLGMHPLDEAAIFKKLLENGESIEALAKRFDRTVAAIWQRVQLLNLEDDIKMMFRNGSLSLQSAAMLNSLNPEGQSLFYKKFKDDFTVKQGKELAEWEVSGFISGLNNDRLYKCIMCKQCESCKTRTYFTDTNLFPELSSTYDSCLNHSCYFDKWTRLLENRIKSLKGENQSYAEANLFVSSDNSLRKLFGKSITLNGMEYTVKPDHWETRTKEAGKNTHCCFYIDISSGKLNISLGYWKEPKAKKQEKQESVFLPIVNLLDLPKEEAVQTLAAFQSKYKPKHTWDDPSGDIKRTIKTNVMNKMFVIKAQQPDNEKEIDLFLETYLNRNRNEKTLRLFTGTTNIKDIRKLSWPKLFALLNALNRSESYYLPDFEEIGKIKKHDIAEWAGITINQLKEMYREEIKAQVPPLKQEKKSPDETKPVIKKKPHTGLLQGKGKGKKK